MDMLTFRPITPNAAKRRRMVPMADVMAVTRAAAKLALQGESFNPEDRADCSAWLLGKILERASVASVRRGRPADVLDFITRAMDDPNLHLHVMRSSVEADYIPARFCGLDYCVKVAGAFRRSLESQRTRDAVEAAAQAAEDFTPDVETGATDEVRGTAHGARVAALDMLRSAGLIGDRLPVAAKQAATPHAPLWTLAYTAARASAGLESSEIAAELDMDAAAHRKALSRAARELDYSTPVAWGDALHVLTGGLSYGVHTARQEGVKVRLRDALRPDAHAPVHCKPIAKASPLRKRAPWSAAHVSRIPGGERKMVEPLKATTRARYAKATAMRRARAAARTPEDIRTARLAAGLVASVR